MPVALPFRTSPILGPGLRQTSADYVWDTIARGDTPSYQPGTLVLGSDGREHLHVRAVAALAAAARVTVNDTTWAATADAAGAWQTNVAVPAGEWFHARRFTL